MSKVQGANVQPLVEPPRELLLGCHRLGPAVGMGKCFCQTWLDRSVCSGKGNKP